MLELSRDEEQKIVEALTALDWTEDLDGKSLETIMQLQKLSVGDANAMVDHIYLQRKLIKAVSGQWSIRRTEADASTPLEVDDSVAPC